MRKLIRHDIGLSSAENKDPLKTFIAATLPWHDHYPESSLSEGWGNHTEVWFLYCRTIQNVKFVVENFLGNFSHQSLLPLLARAILQNLNALLKWENSKRTNTNSFKIAAMLLFVTNKKYSEQHQNVFPKLFYFFMILGNHESLKLDIFQKKVLSRILLLSKHPI